MKLPFLKFVQFVFGPFYRRVLFRMTILGTENLPEGGAIICCNHQNAFDPVTVGAALRLHRFWSMAKEELFHNKIAAFFIRALGGFPVVRERGDTKAIVTAEQLVSAGEYLLIFPEGTRSKTGELGRIKPGALAIAAACQAPIIPCNLTLPSVKPKFFRKTAISFGKPLSLNDLFGEDYVPGEKPTKSQYREGCTRLGNEILALKREDLI